MSEFKIGIIVADVDEYVPLAKRIESGEYEEYSYLSRKGHKFEVSTQNGKATVISVLCGIGKVNAAVIASHFKTIGCDIILNYGLSGGISGIKKGELTIATEFVEHDFDLSGIGYKLCEKPGQRYIYKSDDRLNSLMDKILKGAKKGIAVSGDSFICDEAVKSSMKENFNAMSCDMETAAIAYVCDFGNIPFLSLRQVSDDAGDDAASSYKDVIDNSQIVLSDIIFDFIKVVIDSYEE